MYGDLAQWITKLSEAKKNSKALNYGNVVLTNHQCIFERAYDDERVLVAITHLTSVIQHTLMQVVELQWI